MILLAAMLGEQLPIRMSVKHKAMGLQTRPHAATLGSRGAVAVVGREDLVVMMKALFGNPARRSRESGHRQTALGLQSRTRSAK
ncbi:MAG: hypothetical protein OXQ31_26280 [Spirochaetaceae bacterium]|nr:hypothetical protein [Spirochaetaceae bacterium]